MTLQNEFTQLFLKMFSVEVNAISFLSFFTFFFFFGMASPAACRSCWARGLNRSHSWGLHHSHWQRLIHLHLEPTEQLAAARDPQPGQESKNIITEATRGLNPLSHNRIFFLSSFLPSSLPPSFLPRVSQSHLAGMVRITQASQRGTQHRLRQLLLSHANHSASPLAPTVSSRRFQVSLISQIPLCNSLDALLVHIMYAGFV